MSESIRAVERALDVLLCFTTETPQLTMTQISEKVGINKSTVHRLLATLEGRRFVERDPATGVYKPGIRLLQLNCHILEHNDLRRLASPFLQNLSDLHRENVNLSVLDGSDVVYVDVIESPQRVKLAATSGQRLPAFCTASGKAILAFLPEETVHRVLALGMPGFTTRTLSSPQAFFADIQLIRDRGFAISEQEYEEGINAVAAPIYNDGQHPIASVSVAGPAYRLTRERMVEIGPQVLLTARSIGLEIRVPEPKR
jgi:DNA-binding IclR family transcriptional regulator